MKLIKTFESFQSDIYSICRKYNIKNYTINEDGSIDVNDIVDLSHRELTKLPLRFNKVSGSFYCYNNRLTSLEGCPIRVGGNFDCSENQLITLEGCPSYIGGNFDCHQNPVYSIWGIINNKEYLELFLDYDIVDGDSINLLKLNDILIMMGKEPVTEVKGYKCI